MHLMEERLLPYTWTRTLLGAPAASGLKQPGGHLTGTVHLDLQEDSRVRFTDDTGSSPRRGDFIAFSYDTDIQKGDRLTTPHGVLEVVFISPWDDLEPPHREITLRFA